jgi:hypothetical protein
MMPTGFPRRASEPRERGLEGWQGLNRLVVEGRIGESSDVTVAGIPRSLRSYRRGRLEDAKFGVVFCGGGPATLGPFVSAARTGRLDELLDQGVLVVERGRGLGGGSLSHYGI